MIRYLLVAVLLTGCASAPIAPEEPAAAAEEPEAVAPVDPGVFRLILTGEPLAAPRLKIERLGVIPFGKWLNAIPVKRTKHGTEFSVELVECGSFGCIVRMEDSRRVLIAKRELSGAIRLDIYDRGWRVSGSAAISNGGQVAIPATSPEGEGEVWIIRKNERMRKRIPHPVRGPSMLRWHSGGLFLLHQSRAGMAAYRIDIPNGKAVSATPIEAWWTTCDGGPEKPLAVGIAGEIAETLKGTLSLPLHRQGDSEHGWLVLTNSARPMTTRGPTEVVRVTVDCLGRFNVVSALGEEIWCLRFSPGGKILNASRIESHIAGDATSIAIDEYGRFYYLAVEMNTEKREPRRMHFVKMN